MIKLMLRNLLDKAKACKGLTHREASVLLNIEDENYYKICFKVLKKLKKKYMVKE